MKPVLSELLRKRCSLGGTFFFLVLLGLILGSVILTRKKSASQEEDAPRLRLEEPTQYRGEKNLANHSSKSRRSRPSFTHQAEDPTSWSTDALEAFIFEIADDDPAEALVQLESLFASNRLDERFLAVVISEYFSQRPEFLLETLKGSENIRFQSEVLRILFSEEGSAESAESWLSWIRRNRDRGFLGDYLEIAAYSALNQAIKNLGKEQRHEIFSELSQLALPRLNDPAFEGFLIDFGKMFVTHFPARLPDLAKRLPPGEMSRVALEQVITLAAKEEPREVAEWLSSPESFSDIYAIQTSAAQEIELALASEDAEEREAAALEKEALIEEGYDRALLSYINAIVRLDPDSALAAVELIYEQELRSKMRKHVETMAEWQKNQKQGTGAN